MRTKIRLAIDCSIQVILISLLLLQITSNPTQTTQHLGVFYIDYDYSFDACSHNFHCYFWAFLALYFKKFTNIRFGFKFSRCPIGFSILWSIFIEYTRLP